MFRAKPATRPQIDQQFDQLFESVHGQPTEKGAGTGSGGPRSGDFLDVHHLLELARILGVHEDDVILYAIAWKLDAKTPHVITREEWEQGFARLRIESLARLQAALPALRHELASPASFKPFYYWVFDWSRESPQAKYLSQETAVTMWPLLFAGHTFHLLPEWIEFWNTVRHGKGVTRDVWRQTLEFSTVKLTDYDDEGSWPSVMDDFVTWAKAKSGVLPSAR